MLGLPASRKGEVIWGHNLFAEYHKISLNARVYSVSLPEISMDVIMQFMEMDLNSLFSRDGTETANKHMERCSTLLPRWKCKPKPQRDMAPLPLRRLPTTEQKTWNIDGDVEKLGPYRPLAGRQPLRKPGRRFLKTFQVELPCDPAIPLLGIYPKELKVDLKSYLYSHVQSSIIHNSRKASEATQVSIHG